MRILERVKGVFFASLMVAAGFVAVSCGGDDFKDSQTTNVIIKQLAGTSWMTKSIVFYDYNNKEVSKYDCTKYPDVITFTDKKANAYNDDMVLYVDYHKYHPDYNGYTLISHWNVAGNSIDGYPGGGNTFGEILNISKNEIKTKYIGNWENEWYRIEVYVPANEPVHNFKNEDGGNSQGDGGNNQGGSGSNQGGVSTACEKPEIGLVDYTCYQTSLTVKYRIYNQDKANVTSAKGYYGTSSASRAVSASVAGSLITIRISGLKKGTTYYVKCSATGKGGTTTSETTKFITNY